MLKVQSSARVRLLGVAFLMALAAGCGGGGADPGGGPDPAGPPAPVPAPAPAPVANPWGVFPDASVVLGQTGFDQTDPQATPATPIPAPVGATAVMADGTLYVAASDQILAFSPYDTMNGPVAAATYPMQDVRGLSAQGTRLVVAADFEVHIFDSAADLDSGTPNISGGGLGCSASTLNQPASAYLTPLGQLIVADAWNHRVLIWNALPATNTLGDADIVLGQADPESCNQNRGASPGQQTMAYPWSVWSDGVRLVVADSGNNRVLVWDSFPTAADQASHLPKHVLGQVSFTEAGENQSLDEPTSTSLSWPASVDVSESGELAVADSDNSRVLIWSSLPTRDTEPAAYVIGQGDFVHDAANDPDQEGADGDTPSAKTLSFPDGVRFHGRNLIVTDHGNSRVLVWRAAN